MKFLTDEMHGNLTNWLRLLGYDTKFAKDYEVKYGTPVDDDNLIIEAIKDGRIVITNDREMAKKLENKKQKNDKIKYILLNSDDLIENMSIIRKELDLNLDFDGDKARCSKCNSELDVVKDRQKYKDLIPELVFENQDIIWKCSNDKCNQFYWIGGHFKNILKQLAEINNH